MFFVNNFFSVPFKEPISKLRNRTRAAFLPVNRKFDNFSKPNKSLHYLQNCLHSIAPCKKKEVEIQFDIPRQSDEGSRQLMDGVWCSEDHFHYYRWLYLFDLRCSMFHCYFGILLDGSKMAKQVKFLIVKMHKNAHQSSNCY